jgi:repressor LexA
LKAKKYPRIDKIELLANYFGISKSDLIENRDIESTSNAVRINVYGTVPAGVPIEAVEDIVDWEELPREMTAGGKEYFGLRVKGDSMFPRYLDGDTIIVLIQPDCESGEDAVVYVNGYDATLKKVIKKETGVLLQPLNHNYEPVLYSYVDLDHPVTILGVVDEIRRKVR